MEPDTTGGLRGYKGSLDEVGLRGPTIVAWQGRIPPRVTRFPAVAMDIFATLADLADVPAERILKPQDGQSLVPVFDEEPVARDKPIPFAYRSHLALIDNRHKILELSDNQGRRRWELYDLVDDPAEQDNLLEQRPELARNMKQQLADLAASIGASVDGKDYPAGRVRPDEPDPVSWTDDPRYQPWRETWKARPEYRRWLNPPPAKKKYP